jgi:NHL repeat-containing protein
VAVTRRRPARAWPAAMARLISGTAAAVISAGLVPAGAGVAAAGVAPGILTTVAGGPGRGPGWSVAQRPVSLATGPGGAVYVGDARGVVHHLRAASAWEGVTAGVGGGQAGDVYGGDGHPAAGAHLGYVSGLAVDGAGDVLVADPDNARIRMVAAATGTRFGQPVTAGDIYTVAGNGEGGFAGDGGPAVSARLSLPLGVAAGPAGNLVIADTFNNRIRVVAASTGTFYGLAMTAGDIYTVAGNGSDGPGGDGGPAAAAALTDPGAVVADAAGNLVIADTEDSQVRVVAAASGRFYGQAMTAGDIYTVAGDGRFGFSGDGGPAVSARLTEVTGVVADAAGNLVIADSDSNRVRVVAAASGRFYGQAMTAGDIYTVAGSGAGGFSGDGGPAAGAGLRLPVSVAVDAAGNLLITSGSRVRAVAGTPGTYYGRAMAAGAIYTVAGRGLPLSGDHRPARNAVLPDPAGVAVSRAGDIAVYDRGEVRLVAPADGGFAGQPIAAGHIYAVAGNGVAGGTGNGGPAPTARVGASGGGVAFDGAGNLVIADTASNQVRVVAAASGTFYGQPMTAGDIYAVAGDGTAGLSGDGGPAVSAALSGPCGVAAGPAGNLVIADTGNGRVRVVAARSGSFYGRAMAAGDIYTVAANLAGPSGVAADSAGNLVVATPGSDQIWVVAATDGTFYGQPMTAGGRYAVAGKGLPGFSGEGGPATSARLNEPRGVAVDPAGNLVIADTSNNRIRVVAVADGTFYGRAMTAGHIYTVAGTGLVGYFGDGALAIKGRLSFPSAVASSPSGAILLADTANLAIRQITP